MVLASGPDLESGFSRDLFLHWAGNAANSVILTVRTSPGTLARDLIDNGGDRVLTLTVKKRVRLEGAELEEYLQTQVFAVKKNPQSLLLFFFYQENSEPEVELSSDSDDELQLIKVTQGRHDFVMKDAKPQQGVFKTSKKENLMFPFKEKKVKIDDYGEVINPDDYRSDFGEREAVKEEQFDEGRPEEKEAPTKCIASTKQVDFDLN